MLCLLVVLQALHRAYESLSHTATGHVSAQNGHKGTPPAAAHRPPATDHNGAEHSQTHTAGSQSDGQLSWTTEERESGSPHTNGQDHAHNGRDHAPKKDDHRRSRCVRALCASLEVPFQGREALSVRTPKLKKLLLVD